MGHRVHLVRHATPAAGFGGHHDPGLSDDGRRQAEAVAEHLVGLDARRIVSSPLARCRETAAPLAARWGREVEISPAVGEIESPDPDLETRSSWLRGVMQGTWDDLPSHEPWRRGVADALRALGEDAVVFSHFIAINTVVGEAQDRRDVVCFTPDVCSVTIVDIDDAGRLEVVELGSSPAAGRTAVH